MYKERTSVYNNGITVLLTSRNILFRAGYHIYYVCLWRTVKTLPMNFSVPTIEDDKKDKLNIIFSHNDKTYFQRMEARIEHQLKHFLPQHRHDHPNIEKKQHDYCYWNKTIAPVFSYLWSPTSAAIIFSTWFLITSNTTHKLIETK